MDRTAGGCGASASSAADPAGRPGPVGFWHAAGVARSWDHLVALAVPFVQDGLRAGDLTVLSCATTTAERIRAELGELAAALGSADQLALVGSRAPDAMAAARRLANRAAGSGSGRLRVLAEVQVAPGLRDVREGERYESACNEVFAASPITTLCLYDGAQLPEPVIEGVRATHPLLVDGDQARPNPGYRDPRDHVRSLPVPRDPVQVAPPVLAVDEARSLPDLRHALFAVVDAWVRDPEQREDLRLGLAEVAANAFRHGGRPVSARAWVDAHRIVCTVSDRGDRPVDPLAGFLPAHGDDLGRGGMGLWLARKLFDSVDLIAGPGGLTVRLATDLR